MEQAYSDSVGNVISMGDHLCITATGAIGRVVAIDRYRDVPIQVMLRKGDSRTGTKPLCRWVTGARVVRCPDSDEVAGQRFGVALSDRLPSGDWQS